MKSLPGNIVITDYLYDLPDESIAQYPLPQRDLSRLLVWDGKRIRDKSFKDLPSLLGPETHLVFNNTKVIRARLLFTKESGARIEIFCLEPLIPADFAQNLSSDTAVEWKCLIGNLKRWKQEPLVSAFEVSGCRGTLRASKISPEGDAFRVRFEWDSPGVTFAEVLESLGHVPIPPYLGRDDDESDRTRYQTLYAKIDGSVAAPTAGLHFTPRVTEQLESKGVTMSEITLHVSAGTFRPVKSVTIADHQMHTEHFYANYSTIKKLSGRDIIAVGTTTVRALESMYWLGVSIATGREPGNDIPHISQWEPYESDSGISMADAFNSILSWMHRKGIAMIEVKTDIIIVPGYMFRVIKGMLTNFHQPGSTLLLLIAAYTGESWKSIYDHALSSGYRFLSYGDAMLLKP